MDIGRRDLRMQRENPFGAIAAPVRRCFEELVDRSVELERHRLDVIAQLVPRREPVLARDQRLRIVQGGRLARLEKLLRLTFELVEVGTGGELLGRHRASMLNAGGPQAGQHGDSRAGISISRVDSVLRADPHAPRAHWNDGQRRARRQAVDLMPESPLEPMRRVRIGVEGRHRSVAGAAVQCDRFLQRLVGLEP